MPEIADMFVRSAEASIQLFWMPFLIWTLSSLFILLMFKVLRISHPLFHYRARLALLLSLPFVFVFTHFISFSFFSDPQTSVVSFMLAKNGGVTELLSKEIVNQPFYWPVILSGLSLLVAFLSTIWGIFRLLVNLYAQNDFKQSLFTVHNSELIKTFDETKEIVSLNRSVHLCKNADTRIPLTFGFIQPVIVLPDIEYNGESLRTILIHEMIHIKRADYLLKLIQEFIRAVFLVNPLVTFISHEIDNHREISCDAEVLYYNTTSTRNYASLLLAMADVDMPNNSLCPSMAQNKSTLKQRISAMKHYNSSHIGQKKSNSASLVLSGILAISIVFLSSCDFSGIPKAVDETELYQQISKKPEPIGGMKSIYNNLVYPQAARQEGIDGNVYIRFTIDADGEVKNTEILQGIGGGANEHVISAIENTTWLPGEQNGKIVPVQIDFSVSFRLSGFENSRSSAPPVERESDKQLVIVGYGTSKSR